MATPLRGEKFVIRKESPKAGNFLANLATSEALYDYYGTQPWTDVTGAVAQKIASAYPSLSSQKTIFTDFLNGTGRKMSVTTPKIRWKLAGNNRISFRIQENVIPGNTTPGIQFSTFPIKLTTDKLLPGDRIAPERDRHSQLTVQSEPVPDGDGFIYDVVYSTHNPNLYFPAEYLEENLRFCKAGGSVYSEGSSGWGSAMLEHGISFLEFEVGMFKTGKQFTFTDEALDTVISIDPTDELKKEMPNVSPKITTIAEMQFMNEVKWEKELDLTYGRGANAIDQTTGLYREYGASLFEFLRQGNMFSYSPVNSSIKTMTDWLDSVWYDRVTPQNAYVKFYTGKPGLELADKWIREEFGETAVIRNVEDYIERMGSIVPGGRDAFKLKYPMFKAYEIPTYGMVEFEHWPILDSTWLGSPLHPKTGKPLTGYEFVVLNYGLGRGSDSNVIMVDRQGSEYWGYETGMVSPAGHINARNGGGRYQAVHAGRSMTLRHGHQYGFLMKDVTLSAWFKPNIS